MRTCTELRVTSDILIEACNFRNSFFSTPFVDKLMLDCFFVRVAKRVCLGKVQNSNQVESTLFEGHLHSVEELRHLSSSQLGKDHACVCSLPHLNLLDEPADNEAFALRLKFRLRGRLSKLDPLFVFGAKRLARCTEFAAL